MVSLGLDGTISNQGSVSEIIAKDHKLAAEVITEQEILSKAESELDPLPKESKPDGKLTLKEEVHHGHISRAACAYTMIYVFLSEHKV